MFVKLFEIRDSGTRINAIAVKVAARNEREDYICGHAGYVEQIPCILLTYLEGDGRPCTYDPWDWNSLTMRDAHLYIEERWDELKSGDVICTEYLRRERDTPKKSEQFAGFDCRWSQPRRDWAAEPVKVEVA